MASDAIDLSMQPLDEIPAAVLARTDLAILKLHGCGLTELPAALFALPLEELVLARNRLTTLPDAIGKLTRLRVLRLSINQLSALPDALFTLPLEELGLSRNPLPGFPDGVTRLARLRLLHLEGIPLDAIPPSIASLQELGTIDLRNCGLTDLPAELLALPRLHHISLVGNPIPATTLAAWRKRYPALSLVA